MLPKGELIVSDVRLIGACGVVRERDGAGVAIDDDVDRGRGNDAEDFALAERREEAVAELDHVEVAGVVLGERGEVLDVGAAADGGFERGGVILEVGEVRAVVVGRRRGRIEGAGVDVAVDEVGEEVAALEFGDGAAVDVAAGDRTAGEKRGVGEGIAAVGVVEDRVEIAGRAGAADAGFGRGDRAFARRPTEVERRVGGIGRRSCSG